MKHPKDTTHPIVYWAIGLSILAGYIILAWIHFVDGP